MNPKCNYQCFLAILLLNTKETPKQKTIEKVFRRIALTIHPDKCKEHNRQEANQMMQQLVQAKNVLIKLITGQEIFEDEVNHNCDTFTEAARIIRKLYNKHNQNSQSQKDNTNDKANENHINSSTGSKNHETDEPHQQWQTKQQPSQNNSQTQQGEEVDEDIIYEGTFQSQYNEDQNDKNQDNEKQNNNEHNNAKQDNENHSEESHNKESNQNNYQDAKIEKILSHHVKRRSLMFQVKLKGYELIANKNLAEALKNKKALKNYINNLKNISKRRFNHIIKTYPPIMELYATEK